LGSIVIAINKIERVPVNQKEQLFDFFAREANAVGVDSSKFVAIDTKTDLSIYYPNFEEKLRDFPAYNLDGMNELEGKVEDYFQEELKNEENYENVEEKIPEIIEKTIEETISIDQPYTRKCNCRKVCKTRILGLCVDRNTKCDTCNLIRQIPHVVKKVIQEIIYHTVVHRRLKNEEDYYKRVAKGKIIREMRSLVFQQKG